MVDGWTRYFIVYHHNGGNVHNTILAGKKINTMSDIKDYEQRIFDKEIKDNRSLRCIKISNFIDIGERK